MIFLVIMAQKYNNFYDEFGIGREPNNFYLLFFPNFFILKKLILGEKGKFYSLIYTFVWVGICISDYVQPRGGY